MPKQAPDVIPAKAGIQILWRKRGGSGFPLSREWQRKGIIHQTRFSRCSVYQWWQV